jgi:hypothetical protein
MPKNNVELYNAALIGAMTGSLTNRGVPSGLSVTTIQTGCIEFAVLIDEAIDGVVDGPTQPMIDTMLEMSRALWHERIPTIPISAAIIAPFVAAYTAAVAACDPQPNDAGNMFVMEGVANPNGNVEAPRSTFYFQFGTANADPIMWIKMLEDQTNQGWKAIKFV